MKSTNLFFSISLSVLFFCPLKTLAWQTDTLKSNQSNLETLKEQKKTNTSILPNYRTNKSALKFNSPIDEIWDKIPYPIEGVNFTPSAPLSNIGDINGDGFTDLAKITNTAALIYFGGDTLSKTPDQILNFSLLPIGDMNLDGYADAFAENISGEGIPILYSGSPTGFVEISSPGFNEFYSSFIKRRTISNRSSVITNAFINDDNFPDIVSSYSSGDIRFNHIIYANSDLFDVGFASNVKTVENSSNYISGFFLDSFNQKDKTYFVYETYKTQYDEIGQIEFNDTYLSFFELTEADTLLNVEEILLPYLRDSFVSISTRTKSQQVFMDDFNNDNLIDVIDKTREGNLLFRPGLEADTLSFKSVFSEVESDDTLIDSIVAIQPIGDIDSDGKSDLMYLPFGNNKIRIGSVDGNPEEPLFEIQTSINSNNFIPSSYFGGISNSTSGLFGRTNQNRYNHGSFSNSTRGIPLSIQGEEAFGDLLVEFDDNQNSPPISKLTEYNTKDYTKKSINSEVFYLGDLESDGIDNFAVVQIRENKEYILFYNGFFEDSVQEIEIPDSLFTRAIVAGNFLSQTEKQVAILGLEQGVSSNAREIFLLNIYDPLNINSGFIEEKKLSRTEIINNIGDVNNDGYDDIGLSSGTQGTFSIYFGNENTFSELPGFTVTADSYLQVVEADVGSSSFGITLIQSVGDINKDGIDDFILSDPSRANFTSIDFNISTMGSIYIFYGKNEDLPSFEIPDFELLPDTTNPDDDLTLFGGLNEVAIGDFDGDDLTDIAAKSFYHRNADRTEGVGAIHYYFGKNDLSSRPDTTIPIRFEYVYPETNNFNLEYSTSMGRTLMKAVDVDKDGEDELLLVPNSFFRYAVLYKVGNNPTEIAHKLYKGLQDLPLSPAGGYIDKQYSSLVGDFKGDGGLYFLGSHNYSEYRDTPILMFDLVGSSPNSNEEITEEFPRTLSLSQNYPNPFNPSTRISFSLPQAGFAQLSIFNVLGQKVAILVDEVKKAGNYTVSFNATSLSSGIYFYRLETAGNSIVKKMMLIK